MIKIADFILIPVSIIYAFALAILGLEYDLCYISCILTLSTNIFLILRNRDNYFLAITFSLIFYFNYSIIYSNFIYNADNFFTQEINTQVTNTSINILSLFNVILYVLFPKKVEKLKYGVNYMQSSYNLKKGMFYCIFCSLCIIFISDNIGASVSSMEKKDASSIYEYSVCVFIVAYYFIKEKKYRLILNILLLVFAFSNFVFGGRVSGLQFLICIYIFELAYRIKLLKVIMISLPVLVLMVIIGNVRAELISGNFSTELILRRFLTGGLSLDTAYAAYYTSEVFVFASDFISDHISLFFILLGAIFVGYGYYNNATLPKITSAFLKHYNGGIFPFYFWFYFGYIGIIISAIIVNFYLTIWSNISKQSGLFKCLGAFSLCHIFRWYLYTPYSFFRGSLFLIILYLFVKYLGTYRPLLKNAANLRA